MLLGKWASLGGKKSTEAPCVLRQPQHPYLTDQRNQMAKSPAWQRKEGKNPEGGLNAKGRASAKKEGHNLKPPVSKEQAKKSPKAAARRESFCARMEGMKKKNTSSKTAKDPDSRINKSLRKWDC